MATIYEILKDIKSPRRKKIILDTDTYNEIDDQYAVAWSVLSGEKLDLLSINAAPFFNSRSTSPAEGMEKSYNEIFNILKLAAPEKTVPVYRGSTSFLADKKVAVESDAAKNIVKTVTESDEIVYVVAIGAITNVASAIIMEPKILENMAVIWLGGHALHAPHTREFNMVQDVMASQIIFDSKVPLLVIPCLGVCDRLATTIPELTAYLSDKNELCSYLLDITKNYTTNPYCWSKVIWDVSAIAALLIPNCLDFSVIPTPIITDDCYFARNNSRHHMIYTEHLNRDKIFAKLFEDLAK